MKSPFQFINKANGFYLPYILFIITICFIVLTASINIYKNDIQITNKHVEQIKIETLFQMGRAKLKQDIKKKKPFKDGDEITYNFQEETVKIKVSPLGESSFQLHFTIRTDKDTNYTFTNRLRLEFDTD